MVSEDALDAAWNSVLAVFARRTPLAAAHYDTAALGVIRCAGAAELLFEFCAEQIRADIGARLAPAFWRSFAAVRPVESARRTQCSFFEAVHALFAELHAHADALTALEAQLLGDGRARECIEQLLLHSHALLLVIIPEHLDYASLAVTFWDQSLRDYCRYQRLDAGADGRADSDDSDDDAGANDDPPVEALLPSAQLEAVRAVLATGLVSNTRAPSGGGRSPMDLGGPGAGVGSGDNMPRGGAHGAELELLLGACALCCAELASVGWLRQLEEALSHMLSARVQSHVRARCAASFESRLLPEMLRWLTSQLLPWLRLVSESGKASIVSTVFATASAGISSADWAMRCVAR
jgi:hypothetical protein